jgi:signal peptidase II
MALQSSPDSPSRAAGMRRLFVTAVSITVLDQVVKKVVTTVMELGESVDFLGTVVRFTRTANTGAAFGMLRGRSLLFIIISALAALAIAAFSRQIARQRTWEQLSFGLILGGAVGNLIDRVRLGAVVDFINIGIGDLRWPYFNVADSAITIGVAILAFHLLFRPQHPTEPEHLEGPERLDSPDDLDASRQPDAPKDESP